MLRKAIAVALSVVFSGCGSQFNMPFSSSPIPSSFSLGGKGGQASQAGHADSGQSGQTSSASGGLCGVTVLAHFVNWHSKAPGFNSMEKDGNTHPLRVGADYPPGGIQTGGVGYDSNDPAIIRQQNDEMEKNCITPLVSWWGPAGSVLQNTGDLFYDRYLSIPGPQFGVLYEASERLIVTGQVGGEDQYSRPEKYGEIDFNNPENTKRFIADMDHLNQKYFSNPKYAGRFYRINGRPVVFVWLTGAFRGPFDNAALQAKSRDNIYIIGANFNMYGSTPPAMLPLVRGVDALSSYGNYNDELAIRFGGHINQEFVDMYRDAVAVISLWLANNTPNVPLLLPIQFSYKDNRGNTPLTSTKAEAEYFAKTVRAIVDNAAANCRNIVPIVLLDSYNEHYEGSGVEPSREYGYDFLNIVRETFQPPLAAGTCGR